MNKLTVLMPVYNGEKYLQEAIESVLNQTFTEFDFLIIDDGSSDSSLAIIKSYNDSRIKLIVHEQNKKLIATLNEGLHIAQTKYVARIDCDDIAVLDRFEKQMEYLKAQPRTVVVGSDIYVIDEGSHVINTLGLPSSDKMIRWYAATNNPFAHGSVIMDREVALRVGGYNKNTYLIEDYDLWLRMMKEGIVENIPEPLYLWRQIGTSESGRKGAQMNEASQKIKDAYWDSFDGNEPFKLGDTIPEEYVYELKTCKDKEYRKRYLVRMHVHLADGYARRKNAKQKIRQIMAAIRLKPRWLYRIFLYSLLAFPAGWIMAVKKNAFLYKKAKQLK